MINNGNTHNKSRNSEAGNKTPEEDSFGILFIDPGVQLKCSKIARYVNRGLLSIATFIKSKGFNVNYFCFDQFHKDGVIDEERVFSELKRFIHGNSIRVAAITNLFIAETENTLKVARYIKELSPEIITVIGGYNPTIMNQELIERKEIDFIIKGEGEWALCTLVSALKNGESTENIPGLVSKEHEGPERRHGNLDELPPLDYSILPKEYLLSENPPRINLELSRGCYKNCSFCSVSAFWKSDCEKVRHHKLDELIKELEYLKSIGYKGKITVEESTVNLKAEDTKEFLGKLKRFRDDFYFEYIATRYDYFDEESLGLLDEIGFVHMIFGLESASKQVMDKVHKDLDLDAFVDACEIVRNFKIKLTVFMIVGLPGETKETHRETMNFLKRLQAEGLIFGVFPCHFQPYRGTKASKDLKEAGGRSLARESDYFKWLMRDEPLVEYNHLRSEELKGMMAEMLALNIKNGKNVIDDLM